jgi:hypothetical protein
MRSANSKAKSGLMGGWRSENGLTRVYLSSGGSAANPATIQGEPWVFTGESDVYPGYSR